MQKSVLDSLDSSDENEPEKIPASQKQRLEVEKEGLSPQYQLPCVGKLYSSAQEVVGEDGLLVIE